ncbi:MAG: glycosyltransferase [Acidobacteriia bacterium]|nr:glycosyltransferase [Terriglobia bacterium]
MLPFALSAAALSLLIWLSLAFARGAFWRLRRAETDLAAAEEHTAHSWPRVAILVPARDEAESIAACVTSLAQQDYPGSFSILVIDDHSADGTADLARHAAIASGAPDRIRIHAASSLAPGWTGKLWALNEGILAASANPQDAPAFYWLTDADIVHAPDTLRRLVACAERDSLGLISLLVLLRTRSLPERLLIPAFLFFFLKLYPPRWVANPRARTAGAAGGCVLLRRTALEGMGGLAAVRGDVIDDCAIARAVKTHGGRIWLGYTRSSQSLRSYSRFAEIRDMIARTAFTQLRYSPLLLLGALAGMFFTYLLPLLLLLHPHPAVRYTALATWLLMSLLYLPSVRFFRLNFFWIFLLPLAALYYSYATLLSALRYWMGRGGQWKGRSQAAKNGKIHDR